MKKANSIITVVAQTPFQLFMATVITTVCDITADLWLLDPTLKSYIERCIASGLWHNVKYLGNDNPKKGTSANWNWVSTLTRIVEKNKQKKIIRRYLASISPEALILFSDNHETTAAFARLSKKLTFAKVIMVEEGTTVYFPYDRVRAPTWKAIGRALLGCDNPKGFSIGWSPWVDTLILSSPNKSHPKYIRGRKVVAWPDGPFPLSAINNFIKISGISSTLPASNCVDIIFLGQPLARAGLLSQQDESRFLEALDNLPIASRIWLKPHPFDDEEKYAKLKKINLFDQKIAKIPAELIFEYLKPKIVISFFCSAALNYCTRNGFPAIFFAPPSIPESIRFLIYDLFSDLETLKVASQISDIPNLITTCMESQFFPISEAPISAWERSVMSAII